MGIEYCYEARSGSKCKCGQSRTHWHDYPPERDGLIESTSITIDEMRQKLISNIGFADRNELIAIYEKMFDVKIENHGDNYHPCYVEVKKGEKK
jgi:hypothetical protein